MGGCLTLRVYAKVCMQNCVRKRVWVFGTVSVCIRMWISTCICECVSVCDCIYASLCVCSSIFMCYHTITLIGLASSVFANGLGDLGSIPDRVISKTLKMVLDTSLLNTQQYKARIKGKVEQFRGKSSAPHTLM